MAVEMAIVIKPVAFPELAQPIDPGTGFYLIEEQFELVRGCFHAYIIDFSGHRSTTDEIRITLFIPLGVCLNMLISSEILTQE